MPGSGTAVADDAAAVGAADGTGGEKNSAEEPTYKLSPSSIALGEVTTKVPLSTSVSPV